jgi:hypothetical protein
MQCHKTQFEEGKLVQIDYVAQGAKISRAEANAIGAPLTTIQGPFFSRRAVLVDGADDRAIIGYCFKAQAQRTFLLNRIVNVVRIG